MVRCLKEIAETFPGKRARETAHFQETTTTGQIPGVVEEKGLRTLKLMTPTTTVQFYLRNVCPLKINRLVLFWELYYLWYHCWTAAQRRDTICGHYQFVTFLELLAALLLLDWLFLLVSRYNKELRM